MTAAEAAEYLRITEDWLAKLRAKGAGPQYHRPGGRIVRYDRTELDKWVRRDEE